MKGQNAEDAKSIFWGQTMYCITAQNEKKPCTLNRWCNVYIGNLWPGGVMDSASDFGSEGCGFKSHLGRYFLNKSNLPFKFYWQVATS